VQSNLRIGSIRVGYTGGQGAGDVVVVGPVLCHEVLNELDVGAGRSLEAIALPLLFLHADTPARM